MADATTTQNACSGQLVPVQTISIPSGSIAALPYLGTRIFVQDETGIQYFWDGSNYVVPGGGAGGAEAFTDLTDAPGTITPLGLVIGNSDGTAVSMPTWVTVDSDYHGIDSHPAVPDTNGNGSYFAVNTASGQFNNAQISVNATKAEVNVQAGNNASATLFAEDSLVTLRVFAGNLKIVGLPETDPAIAGALYWNGNVLTRSAP